MPKQPPIWRMPPFVALFADPFIAGTELESGHVAYSCMALAYAIEVFSDDNDSVRQEGSLFDGSAYEKLGNAKKCLEDCMKLAAAQVSKPEDFFKLVQGLQEKIKALPFGEIMMVPGGWSGATTRGTVMHLIEKTQNTAGEAAFAFVTCNSGEGLEYHPSAPDSDITSGKVKYKTCLRISGIPLEKISDSAFWMTLLAQRLKQPPGEYQRSEILYDALLPWLAGDRVLPNVLANEPDDPFADYRTPARSGTSHYYSCWEAVRYICLWNGLTKEQMKQFSYCTRKNMLRKASTDLELFLNPTMPFSGYSTRPARSPIQALGDLPNLVNNGGGSVAMSSLEGKVVGLYFSGHWCGPCREFTPVLTQWYARLMQRGVDFQIVFVSADRDQASFDQYLASMPWPAIAFQERELAQELGSLCEVEGVPTLVLFRPDGSLLTAKGQDIVGEDSNGEKFPWESYAGEPEPREMSVADFALIRYACEQTSLSGLKENKAGRLGVDQMGELKLFLEGVESAARGLPVSEDVRRNRPSLPLPLGDIASTEIIPLSNFDLLSLSGMEKYAGSASQQPTPVLANLLDVPQAVSSVPEAQAALNSCQRVVKSLLQRAMDGSSSSRLVLQYQVIQLIGDLFTKVLPTPKPQSVAFAMGMGKALSAEDAEEEAAEIAKLKAEEEERAKRSAEEAEKLRLEKEKQKDDGRNELAMQLMMFFPQFNFELAKGALELNGDNIEYAGNWLIMNADKAESLIAESRASKAARNSASAPTGDSSSINFGADAAAEAAMEALALENVRNPSENSAYKFRSKIFSLPRNGQECIWCTSQSKAVQMKLLESVHALTMTYASMWQAIESPSREFDSERSCVSLCMLALFDAVIRMPASDEPSVISQILGEDGGYALSTAVCQNNRNVDKVGATMELHAPHMHEARSDALEYLSAMRRSCVRTIFDFRMPMKIEIKKYSTTCYFLKKVLARCGYPLIPRGGPRPPPEIEALCNWLFEPETPLAKNQPEFGMMRNMVGLYKFLTTMQTREHELMARKQQSDHRMMMSFSFSFEEGGRRAAWNMSTFPLRWDVVGFRGAPDKDTADVDCIAFSGRKLFFGEGLVVQSPCDVAKHLEKEMPTEDDVLHAEELPTFDDTLSREESELLFSFLTVDYVRLPLVLNFFADKDRVTYLFNTELQAMLRGLLFEGGPWVPEWELNPITRVPERRTKQQSMQEERDRFLRAELPPDRELLGTSCGLFINDLVHSPDAVLEPILSMLHSIKELTNSSVHSPDATFIIFMLSLALDVQGYIEHALNSPRCSEWLAVSQKRDRLLYFEGAIQEFLLGPIVEVLRRWCKEADSMNDMPTSCVVHAYMALLWSRVTSTSGWNEESITNMLGSLTFVRNWHGFGMGLLRSNYDNQTEPVDRLIRFLQAHGIDTSRTDRKSLSKWTTGGRPLFLRVGRETVRAPTFASPELDKSKLPPSDVPEAALLLMLQRVRRPVVTWLDKCGPSTLDKVLNKIMAVALRNDDFDYTGWSRAGEGLGSYNALEVELKFDVQSAEVLWRNDELRPVPDSMVQFNDYDSMFGREPLHCGIVRREDHRLWVHLVGRNYDIAEWDEPKKEDQGVGFPKFEQAEIPLFWTCSACTMLNEGGTSCNVCATNRPPVALEEGSRTATFENVAYNREFDPYSEKEHPHESEKWFIDILKPVILHEYPPDKPMKFKLILPESIYGEDCNRARLIGCANEDKGNATWKEVQVLRNPGVVHVYNLIPHGRRAYRSQIYTSDSRFSYHSLAVNVDDQSAPLPKEVKFAAGDMKDYRKPSGSLVIMKQNNRTGGHECYIPSRLLQGIVPTVLLEAFRFWQDQTNTLRGSALDEVSQWFNFDLTVNLDDSSSSISIVRNPISKAEKSQGMSQKAKTAVSLLRQSSQGRNTAEASDESEAILLQLINLGFSPASSQLALRRVGNDAERAAAWLFDDANASAISAIDASAEREDTSSLAAPPLRRTNSHNDRVQILTNEGFTAELVEHALNIFPGEANSVELARIWLNDSGNSKEIARITSTDVESDDPAASAEKINDENDASESKRGGPCLVLMDILHCTETSNATLARLRNILTRIEDVSHILIWGSETSEEGKFDIVSVELPRLKLRFSQKMHPDGVMRLHVTDADEWFITDYYSAEVEDKTLSAEKKSILELLKGLPHSILLQNEADEFEVLLCNHDLYRPMVRGAPFSTELVFDRSSVAWQEVMERRFYMLPIHTSRTFLVTNSLASRLYLILLKLVARLYEDAFRLAEVCAIDTAFTPEEKWVFGLIQERAKQDQHPDAHAVRLKLILALMYSDNEMSWEPNVICDQYIKNLAHISACCRLSQDEERNALSLCKVANARLKNRLAALMSQKDGMPNVQVKGDSPRIGGQPWWKIAVLKPAYLLGHLRSTMHYIQYDKPKSSFPGLMKDEEIFKFLWEEELMLDEESGSNRQLGILFLYQLIRNEYKMILFGNDCTSSFADILTRCFHLKHSRWGREAVSEGEQDGEASREMVHLISLLSHPKRSWPALPKDQETTELLKRGLDLHGRVMNRNGSNMIKLFFQFLEQEFRQAVQSEGHTVRLNDNQAMMSGIPSFDGKTTLRMPPRDELPIVAAVLLPVKVSNFGCDCRYLKSKLGGLTEEEVGQFGSLPLASLGLEEIINYEAVEDDVAGVLPFDLEQNPESKTPIAADMIQRLSVDVKGFADSQKGRMAPRVKGLESQAVDSFASAKGENGRFATCKTFLDSISKGLAVLRDADRSKIAVNLQEAQKACASVAASSDKSLDEERTRYELLRFANQRPTLRIPHVTSMVMSANADSDMKKINPFIASTEDVIDSIVEVLFRVSRVRHASRAIEAIRKVKALIDKIELIHKPSASDAKRNAETMKSTIAYLQIQAASLAKILTTKRQFVDESTNRFDPRFLVFEYVFDIVLRPRQVEIVQSFRASTSKDESRVQQMIMGAGKTTVVGPLLTLMLADGNKLVTQVMPSALLQQTKEIMRSRFASAIMPKRVYTLEFERSVEDSTEFVARLFSKLNDAKNDGCVVCAAPEAIKSLALKFIEHLHSVEEFDLHLLTPGESVRENEMALEMKDRMVAKSDMADALVKILNIWKEGILIMDEVDVLLHPLRSELNFPIGHKYPIDLSGYRWDLPIHLCDAIFYAETGQLSEPPHVEAFEQVGVDFEEVLDQLASIVRKGYQIHAIQRSPHLVLLDLKYYHNSMKPLIARWALGWLQHHFVGRCAVSSNELLQYLSGIRKEDRSKFAKCLEPNMSAEAMKLLNLAADWIQTLLPHVLSKINRVSFGILTPADLAVADPRMPYSRRVMAVPFVGKDVPSRSSEFAHPDVLIGLTVLSYRYSGLRRKDLQRVVTQLKQDYSRQVGPRTERPAAVLFRKWLNLAVTSSNGPGSPRSLHSQKKSRNEKDIVSVPVLPLPLFQPNDPVQLGRLFGLLKRTPEVLHYFLRNHIFPKTMNFQKLKVSACGHELGSSILFGARIGFSGTPSNLLPIDLGDCQYEPGSDGRIVHVLTSPRVCNVSTKKSWTAQSLLRDIAKQADPPVHALIDTGALITGMDNREVAEFLMLHLGPDMEGVVYLDRNDRKMVLVRESGRSVSLDQCGIRPGKRFTFYDQVHTTGMDIKQAPTAHAVVTVGKDMTFRDYAQGSYRMRGIGIGQTVEIYLIPEVVNRINEDLAGRTGNYLVDVPAWLLLNSMRMEGLQFVQLSLQELHNVWRKRALGSLLDEVRFNSKLLSIGSQEGMKRLLRFKDNSWLEECIRVFREPIGFPVEDKVPQPRPFVETIQGLVGDHEKFLLDDSEKSRVVEVQTKVKATSGVTMSGDDGNAALNSEVVHENEKQQEEEAQKQVRQEKIKMSAFSRDDEEPRPWKVELLQYHPGKLREAGVKEGESAFYPLHDFQTRKDLKVLPFPGDMLVTDNFFRPSWVGVGDRRLKNVALIMEWIPTLHKVSEDPKESIQRLFKAFVSQGLPPNQAAAAALKQVSSGDIPPPAPSVSSSRFFVALSLSEGETIRRMLHDHTRQSVLQKAGVALRTISGRLLDCSPGFQEASTFDSQNCPQLCCYRFMNTDMYFSDAQIKTISKALALAPTEDRLSFFEEGLRLRVRERNLWADTPVAKLFTAESEWYLLGARSVADKLRGTLSTIHRDGGTVPTNILVHIFASVAQKEARSKALSHKREKSARGIHQWTPSDQVMCESIFNLYADGGYLNVEGMVRFCADLKISVKLVDGAQLMKIIECEHPDKMSMSEFSQTFPISLKHAHLPAECATGEAITDRQEIWLCLGCTFANSIMNEQCVMCGVGWDGRRHVPRNHWECSALEGGCTKYNHDRVFYCDVCGKARPDLASVRF